MRPIGLRDIGAAEQLSRVLHSVPSLWKHWVLCIIDAYLRAQPLPPCAPLFANCRAEPQQ